MNHIYSVAIKRLGIPAGEVRSRTIGGSLWVLFSRFYSQGANIVKLIVIARFLDPRDVGLMALALLSISALEVFTTAGLVQALIQYQGDIQRFFDTAFSFSVARGLTLSIALVAASAPIGSYFQTPEATNVIRASALIILIRGFQSPAIPKVHRDLKFRRLAALEISGSTVSLAIAVALALWFGNVWALLWAAVVMELVLTVGSYVIAPWKMTLKFNLQDFLELNQFGRWILLSSVLVFISLQLDNLVVGRILGVTALGFYEIAFRLSQLPATQVSQVASVVAFPLLSRSANDPGKFQRTYLRIVTFLVPLNAGITVILLLLAEPIVVYGLGKNWLQAVPALQILAVAGFARSIVTIGGCVFAAAGKPRLDSLMNSVRVVIMVCLIVPFARTWQLEGVAVAVLLAISSVIPLYYYLMAKSLGISFGTHLRYLKGAFVSTSARMKGHIA